MSKYNYLNKYAEMFNYNILETAEDNSLIYLKKTKEGFVVIEKIKESKYINFYHQKQIKTFKESDLFLGIINETPIAWEVENDRKR